MRKEIICPLAPPVVGPYSQGIVLANGMIFLSGQLPLDPQSGKVTGDTVAEQAARVFDNIAAVLESAGSGLDRVIKATVFLTDMADFKDLNAVYAERLTAVPKPARSTVAVSALPLGAKVEIEVIAMAG